MGDSLSYLDNLLPPRIIHIKASKLKIQKMHFKNEIPCSLRKLPKNIEMRLIIKYKALMINVKAQLRNVTLFTLSHCYISRLLLLNATQHSCYI